MSRLTPILVLFSYVAMCIFMVCVASQDDTTDKEIENATKWLLKSHSVEFNFILYYKQEGQTRGTAKPTSISCYLEEPTTVDEIKLKVKDKSDGYQFDSCKEDNSIYRNGISCQIPGTEDCDTVKQWCEQYLGGKAQFNENCPSGAF